MGNSFNEQVNDYDVGFIDPQGNFYPCKSYGHLDKALEIVKNLGQIQDDSLYFSGVEAERTLLDEGWVILYARSVIYKFYRKGQCLALPKELKYKLMDLLDVKKKVAFWWCTEKIESLEELLDQNKFIENKLLK